VWGNGIDEALLRFGNGDIWYLDNQLGSVMALADDTGQVIESYSYDAYGAVTVYDASGQQIDMTNYDNRYLFTGREYNWQTKLYHYRARTYVPSLGTFTSIDKQNFWNWRFYANNTPTVAVDPLGYFSAKWHARITQVALMNFLKDECIKSLILENILQDLPRPSGDPTAPYDIRHFDDCKFAEGLAYILKKRAKIAELARSWQPWCLVCPFILSHFGWLLHTVQDFYAHSDWVDLHIKKSLPLKIWRPLKNSLIVKGTPVISGRWNKPEGFKYLGRVVPHHDDINKDDPSRRYFWFAFRMAVEATRYEAFRPLVRLGGRVFSVALLLITFCNC